MVEPARVRPDTLEPNSTQITVYRDGSVLILSAYRNVDSGSVYLGGLSSGIVTETMILSSPVKTVLNFTPPTRLWEVAPETAARMVSGGRIVIRRKGMEPIQGTVQSNGGSNRIVVVSRGGNIFSVPRSEGNIYVFPSAANEDRIRMNEIAARIKGPQGDLNLSYLTQDLRILSEATVSLKKVATHQAWEGTLTQNLNITNWTGMKTIARASFSMTRLNWNKRTSRHRRRGVELERAEAVRYQAPAAAAPDDGWSSEETFDYSGVDLHDGRYSVSVSTANVSVHDWFLHYDVKDGGTEPNITVNITADTQLPPFDNLTLVSARDGQRLGSPTSTNRPMERGKERTVFLGKDSAVEIQVVRSSWKDQVDVYTKYDGKVFNRKRTEIQILHLFMLLKDEEELVKQLSHAPGKTGPYTQSVKQLNDYWRTVTGHRSGHTLVWILVGRLKASDSFQFTLTKKRPRVVGQFQHV